MDVQYVSDCLAANPATALQPGWFEDSVSLNFGLLGRAESVPTVLHDATDKGTDYILKHLILVRPKGGKRSQNDTQGLQN